MMRTLFIVSLGVALLTTACGSSAPADNAAPAASATPESGAQPGAGAAQTSARPAGAPAASRTTSPSAATPAREAATAPVAPPQDVFRDVTIPSGTTLTLTLKTSVASDASKVEDAVTAELRKAVTVDGQEVLPAGATAAGVVTEADTSGRVKGRARVALRFTSLRAGADQYQVSTDVVSRVAEATKGDDAKKIGIGAGAGAALGAILGGKKGAAQGAAVGGGAGAGVVLATRGDEVSLASGTDVTTRLTAPLTVRVKVNRAKQDHAERDQCSV